MLNDKVACVLLQGLLLYQKTTRNSYLEKMDGPARASSNMDRFERCFSIFKLQKSAVSCKWSSSASAEDVSTGRDRERAAEHHSEASGWRAVRVDLVVSPYSQFAFATLGWTGSKVCQIIQTPLLLFLCFFRCVWIEMNTSRSTAFSHFHRLLVEKYGCLL